MIEERTLCLRNDAGKSHSTHFENRFRSVSRLFGESNAEHPSSACFFASLNRFIINLISLGARLSAGAINLIKFGRVERVKDLASRSRMIILLVLWPFFRLASRAWRGIAYMSIKCIMRAFLLLADFAFSCKWPQWTNEISCFRSLGHRISPPFRFHLRDAKWTSTRLSRAWKSFLIQFACLYDYPGSSKQ